MKKTLDDIEFLQLVDPLSGAVTQRLPVTRCKCGDLVLGAASGRISCPTCDRDFTLSTHTQLLLFRQVREQPAAEVA